MTCRFLGKTDGRRTKALGPIRRLMALGIEASEVEGLMRWCRDRFSRNRRAHTSGADDADRKERVRAGRAIILTLMSLGFTETDIAEMAGVDHSTIAHAYHPFDPRILSEETIAELEMLVKQAGAERLKRFLPGLALNVLDTCCDKGRKLDGPTRKVLIDGMRTTLQDALLFSSVPRPMLDGVHACLAQVGDPIHGLYLINAPGSGEGVPEERLAQMKRVEHEIEHILQRYREKRQRLESEIRVDRHIPEDGGIA